MFVDCHINPQTLIQPQTFAGLMTLYESNYLRLSGLVPQLQTFSGSVDSSPTDQVSVRLALLERTRYTATLALNYVFDEGGCEALEPDMQIRVYFDGGLAEALSVSDVHIDRLLAGDSSPVRSELKSRWARNVLLNKWIEYLRDCEHRFTS